MRKKIQLTFTALVLLFTISAFSTANQDANDVIKKVSIALQTGNAEELSKYFTQTIELEIMGEENFYSIAQAQILLKNFFEKSKPSAFKLNHQGLKDVSSFAIGTLAVKTGTLRVSFFMKTEKNQTRIHQLRIEQNDEAANE